jgi:hypothetical protein
MDMSEKYIYFIQKLLSCVKEELDASVGSQERAETMDRRKEKRSMRKQKNTRRKWGEI